MMKSRISGEAGIRTLGDPKEPQRFSRPPRSTTLAPLRTVTSDYNKEAVIHQINFVVATLVAMIDAYTV